MSLFNDSLLSDVKIRQIYNGGTREYFAHKAVLCAHSKWFLNACTGRFKEASQNTIEVLDDDPQNFELMLKFIYTMDLVPLQTDRPTPALKLKLDILDPIGVYILADKYEVMPLLVRTCSQVKDAMATHSGILNGNVINQIITAYYDRCPRVQSSMGITIAQGLDKHAGSWISGAKGSAKHSFEQTVKDYGCFAADLLLALRSSKRFDFSN